MGIVFLVSHGFWSGFCLHSFQDKRSRSIDMAQGNSYNGNDYKILWVLNNVWITKKSKAKFTSIENSGMIRPGKVYKVDFKGFYKTCHWTMGILGNTEKSLPLGFKTHAARLRRNTCFGNT